MNKIAILGNCQIFAVQNYFNANETFRKMWEILPIPPIFQITDGAAILDMLKDVDCIVTQPLHSHVGGCDMSLPVLRSLGGKCIGFPNVYFDGYNPELFYLKIDGGLVRSPLFDGIDYTLANILFSYVNGHSIARCRDTWYSQDAVNFTCLNNVDNAKKNVIASINELRYRETQCTIKSASFIEENLFSSRIFYTMNHPSLLVMNYVTSHIFDELGLRGYITQDEDLFSHTVIPIISPIKGAFAFDDDCRFRIKGNLYSSFEVIAEYYKWFSNYTVDQLNWGLSEQFKINPMLEVILTDGDKSIKWQ